MPRSRASSSPARTPTCQRPRPNYAANGFGYVGQDLYGAGKALAEEAVKRFGLKSGDRAMVWGLLVPAGRGERTKGAVDALKAAGLTVDYNEIDTATNARPRGRHARPSPGYVSSHPDVKLVVTDHGALTAIGRDVPEGRRQEAWRDPHRRLRPLAGHRHRHPGRLDRAGHRSAAVAAGLPADPADVPDQGVRLLRSAHRHRRRLRRQEQRRTPGPAGGEGNPLTFRLFVCRAAHRAARPIEKELSMADPLLRMVNINKTFGEVKALHDVDFRGRPERDRRPAGRQRRRQVDAHQDRHRLSHARSGRRGLLEG